MRFPALGPISADFDHRYLAQQIAAHSEAQTLMKGYARDGDNQAIRLFAAATLPAVQHHLAMAKALNSARGAVASE